MRGAVPRFGAFWAKLERSPTGEVVAWHPFVDHSLDVALAAEALLQLPTWRARFGRLAGRDLSPGAVARMAYLAGLHDAGKLSKGFQARAWKDQPGGHTEEGLSLLLRDNEILDAARARLADWGESVFAFWWAALSHHGRMHSYHAVRGASAKHRRAFEPRDGADPAAEFRKLLDALDAAFPQAHEGGEPLPDAPAVHHAYAGLVMLADWLGSDTHLCPYRATENEERVPMVRRRLHEHLARGGVDGEPWRHLIADDIGVRHLVGASWTERPVQALVQQLPLPTNRGSVTLIEAETGSGKTEAALLWWARLAAAGLVDGLYFALPLRSAAVQLHARVRRAARTLLGNSAPPVLLAVPGYLRVDDLEGVRLAPFEVLWNEPSEHARGPRWDPRTWVAERPKRFLLAPIAVGTIDQVLLSALPLPHAHLRATSALRNLLIVDEVHASDRYMERLLAGVIERHRAAGGHVLLLSATLGESARRRLLGTEPMPLDAALDVPYPAVWVCGERGVHQSHPDSERGTRQKQVAVDVSDAWADPAAIAELGVEAVRRGERVLILVNRVDRCQQIHLLAAEKLGEAAATMMAAVNGVPAPHHSRYSAADRRLLDEAVERRFGKHADAGPVLVVATQTVEQSLDIDADRLITDLCPIDVLLQRIGRLHRHRERGRAPCLVLSPSDEELKDLATRTGSHPAGLGTVYPDVCALIATRRLITERRQWSIPHDNRALVERGTHPDALRAIADESHELASALSRVLGAGSAKHSFASTLVVDWSRDLLECGFPDRIDGANERVGTRWDDGQEDRVLEIDPPWTSQLGGRVDELRIPGHLARGGDPVLVGRGTDSLTIEAGGKHLIYDALGIRRLPSPGVSDGAPHARL